MPLWQFLAAPPTALVLYLTGCWVGRRLDKRFWEEKQ